MISQVNNILPFNEVNENLKIVTFYALNQNLRLRQPGDDDGPALSRSDSVWQEECPFEDAIERHQATSQGSFPYLDIYAQARGVESEVFTCDDYLELPEEIEGLSEEQIDSLFYKEVSRADACRRTAAIFTDNDFDDFFHAVDCRKHWCPVCGGKNGTIHKTRKKAVFNRVDVKKVNFRSFVFTVPEKYRALFQSRSGINQLFRAVSRLVKKYFGKEKGAIATVHLFGDTDKEKFHPHINVLIPEKKEVVLKIQPEMLALIKETWRKALIGMGCVGLKEIDVFYSFKNKDLQKYHIIKYVVRPTWDRETLFSVDKALRRLLVLELKGMQYVRFWGELANCNYRGDQMTTDEMKEQVEKNVGRKVAFRGVVPIGNLEKMVREGLVIKITDHIYKINKQWRSPENGKC